MAEKDERETAAHFSTWNTLRALEGSESVNSIAHDMRILPAGVPPIKG